MGAVEGRRQEGREGTFSILFVELVGCGIGLAWGLGVRHGWVWEFVFGVIKKEAELG
jgi:hypothetical protein